MNAAHNLEVYASGLKQVSNRSQTGLKQVDTNFEILRKTLAYLTIFDEICTKVVNVDSVFLFTT